ncbi:ATP-dependent endonuclease [Methylophilus sp. VKM B-3414]|uniref:ATP-dependent nuclease n=1 Tax=Methylophilus sp. VKM B-3414 TaxID=3076121 RepID=UPI0028C7C07F|nr:ATP-dependent endonuclease [Methylophilus sp. VKM B-3414]MDT7849253.1 ATP-dependent endonuclease [Methylophilus sp. VKM B-3414]
MKIKSVGIKNFRTLKDVTIPFDKVTTFIGPNGAGKSTVLRALDWFFNGKQGSLADDDCSFGAVEEDIEVRVTFSQLTPKDKDALGKYVPAGVETFTAWKYRNPAGIEVLSANAKSFPPFNEIRSKMSAGEKRAAYNELRAADPALQLAAWTNQDAAFQTLTAWEAANVDRLVDAPDVLETNFFGFNSGGKMSGLFDFVLVTADLRASEESQDGKSSILGKIIERSINRTAADAKIAEIVAESKLKQQQVFEETFNSQLDVLTTQLNDVISIYSPGRKVTVEPASIELKAPKTTFNVGMLDGDTETAVDRQGHGFQRTLLISALQLLAQSTAADTEGVICLAIEEPELFQHPIQAQAFAKVLRSLAEDDSKRVQVTYATHSQYFIEAKYFDQVRRLTRKSNHEGKTHVEVNFSTVDLVKGKLNGVVPPDQVDRQLDGVVAGRLTVGLFAEGVLLVEGPSDVALLHGVADKENIGLLETNGVAVIDAGGKGAIPLAHAILTSIGIPTFVLFDGDAGFEGRAIALGRSEKDINSERIKLIKENQLLLAYLDEDVVDFPPDKVGEKVATFADNIESFLKINWTEWVTSCKELEDQAGIDLKKNSAAYRQATLKAGGDIPEILKQILNKVLER